MSTICIALGCWDSPSDDMQPLKLQYVTPVLSLMETSLGLPVLNQVQSNRSNITPSTCTWFIRNSAGLEVFMLLILPVFWIAAMRATALSIAIGWLKLLKLWWKLWFLIRILWIYSCWSLDTFYIQLLVLCNFDFTLRVLKEVNDIVLLS